MINKIYIETESRNVYPERDVLGISGENKFETLQFNLDNFVDGQALLRIERKETTGTVQYEIAVEKGDNCYTLEVLSSLLVYKGTIKMQLVIMQENLEVFKSKTFNMKVLEEIEGDEEIPEQYPTWQELASQKIIEINNKIDEVTDLEQDLEDKVQNGYFKGEKGDTGEPGQNGTDGIDGQDGANGFSPTVSTQTVENGVKVTVTDLNGEHEFIVLNGKDGQVDEQAVAQAVQSYLEQNPVQVPTKTSDLTNDSNYISDVNYVHTDNNYTTQEKQKLAGLSNYDDTEVNQAIANKVDKVTGKDLSTNDFDDTYKTNVDNNTDARHTHTNKQVLDNITSNDISNWNNKSDFSGNYNDLSNKPTIPVEVTENTVSGWGFTKNTGTYSKPQNGIPKTDLESAVQASLDKADTALQTHQDISGKLDTSKVKNAQSTTAGDVYDVRYINSVLGNIETLLQEV